MADSGNNRVLRFNAAVLDSVKPEADLVIGQRDFQSGSANRRGTTLGSNGFDTPFGLTFDAGGNLYVSDYANARVLKFAPPIIMDASAMAVFGQAAFTVKGVPAQPSNAALAAHRRCSRYLGKSVCGGARR